VTGRRRRRDGRCTTSSKAARGEMAEHKKHDSGARRQRWVEGGGLSKG